MLVVLLALPVYALSRLSAYVEWPLLVAGPLVLSVFAFLAYRSDKRAAEAGEWRIPESTLHLIGLLGGWPGAFLAQRAYRHKTSKGPFQVTFWFTILLHQLTAYDSVNGWRFTAKVVQLVRDYV